VGNFIISIKTDEMLLYRREKRLLASLYLFICLFVSVAPISRISVEVYLWTFMEIYWEFRFLLKLVLKCWAFNLKTEGCLSVPWDIILA